MITMLVLGSGGAVPTPDRSPSAYWLTVDGRSALLDPGPGALVRLLKSPHGPSSLDDVDTVLFTHFHLDHCCDLPALLFALHAPVLRSEAPLVLAGPEGLSDHLEALHGLWGDWMTPARRPLEIREFRPGEEFSLGDGVVRFFAADHGERRFSRCNLGLAIRDRHGSTLVHTGDSGPGADLPGAAAGCDLLLAECSTPDDAPFEGHLTPSMVGRLCRDTLPGRVVLTHLDPAVDALDVESLVREHWDGDVVRAADGMLLEIPDPTSGKDPA